MRRFKLASVSLVLFVLLICSCSNIQSQYDKGRYSSVIKTIERKKDPSADELLLKAKCHIAMGADSKALESLFLYLLQDEDHNASERAYAVSNFIRLNTSDSLSVMVLVPEDGTGACQVLFEAYSRLGDIAKAREVLAMLSEGLSDQERVVLMLTVPADHKAIIEAFSTWYAGISEDELDAFLVLLARFSNVSLAEADAKDLLSLTDTLMRNSYYTGDDYRLSVMLKVKGNILEMLYDRVNARLYWSQALRLNPNDEELKEKLQ